MAKYLDNNGLAYLWTKIKATFTQKAFSTIVVGSKKVEADAKDDTLTIVAGDNVTLTPDEANDSITIAAKDTTYGVVSKTADGLAPKLPNETTTTKYLRQDGTWVVPPDTKYTGTSPISVSGTTISHANSGVTAASKGDTSNQTPTWGATFKVPSGTVNATGHLTAFADHTVKIPNATASASAAGLMSSGDKSKLDALPTNATLELTYAKKSDISGMYKYKGSVATEDKLPTSGQTTGDVYNIEAASSYGGAGMNVAWDGSKWDPLGEIFSITAISNSDIDTIVAS